MDTKTIQAKVYPVTVGFLRVFVRGNLAGISFRDFTRHINRKSAADWLRGIRRNARAGKLDYVVRRGGAVG